MHHTVIPNGTIYSPCECRASSARRLHPLSLAWRGSAHIALSLARPYRSVCASIVFTFLGYLRSSSRYRDHCSPSLAHGTVSYQVCRSVKPSFVPGTPEIEFLTLHLLDSLSLVFSGVPVRYLRSRMICLCSQVVPRGRLRGGDPL